MKKHMKKFTKYLSKLITSSTDLHSLSTELWDVADRLDALLDDVPDDILFDNQREVLSKSVAILRKTSDYIDYEM